MFPRLRRRLLEARCRYLGLRSWLAPEGRRLRVGFRELRSRFYAELWTRAAGTVGADIDAVGYEFFRIRRGDRQTFVHLSDVMLDDHVSLDIAGNKPLTYRLLAERGFRPPRHLEYHLGEVRAAYRFVRELAGSAVVKPARDTGGGRGITTGVRSYAQLERASVEAGVAGPDLMVEEEVPGSSYRLLYLGGELVDAVRRDPPTLGGDGRLSLRRLVAEENRTRLIAEHPSALSPLTTDLECRLRLQAQGLTLDSTPPAGRAVRIKGVVNQNSSRENHSVRDSVHPAIVRLGREAAAVLGLQLAGVDLITPDITVPLDEAGGVINEINTTPALHHHYLVSGAPVPVAEMVLDFVLSRAVEHRWPTSGAGAARRASASRRP
jgi:cyanophycin synthetase